MSNKPQRSQFKSAIRRSALLWWSKSTKPKQRDYEIQMFGYGEWFEDNSLHEDDIVKMFQHYTQRAGYKRSWFFTKLKK